MNAPSPNDAAEPASSAPSGGPVHSHHRAASPDPAPASFGHQLLQSKLAVLAILFLVTAVLGIPLLWINRRFSNTERIFWSIVVTLYTLALFAIVAWILWWAYRRIAV
ncbi:MAG: hypothetical protein MI861_03350 [Pirellulales bacterium]|nr:hypothetical protein [Pirellulales bacterium]